MKFYIDDLQVLFPFPSIYKEQHAYMVELKKALDAKGHCLLCVGQPQSALVLDA